MKSMKKIEELLSGMTKLELMQVNLLTNIKINELNNLEKIRAEYEYEEEQEENSESTWIFGDDSDCDDIF